MFYESLLHLLTCEDANPNLVKVATVADVDDVDRIAYLEAEVWL